ncbi:cytochrome P450 [Phaeosphaeriaceae sp. PMI808]|nr:cytochrome P450 [Phaeosphaeriaceae sp. PMI808]
MMELPFPRNPAFGVLIACVVLWVVATRSKALISSILNFYLQWRYPIRDVSGGKQMPSTRYEFPNGNGDVDKFIHGPYKSEIWHHKYGKIYRIWNGMKPEVVVSTASAIQVVFKDSDQHLKAENMGSGYLMGRILGQCVGLINGSAWRNVRKRADPSFMHSASIGLIPKMMDMTDKHYDGLSLAHLGKGTTLDPVNDLIMLPFLMIATVFYGDMTDKQIAWLNKWSTHREALFAYALGGGLARFNISRYLPTETNRCLNKWLRVWADFNAEAYQIAKAKGENNLLVRMWEDSEQGLLPREQVLQTIDESLYANLDVGIGSVSWNLVFLACYPNIQEQLYAEIRGKVSDEGWERYLQRSDTLLEACICESIRLRPIAAFSVPQSAPTDRIADGYLIPAGTNVTVDIYTLNQRNDFWGADPLSYKPSRWADLKPSQTRYNFSRFGFGPRQCMGKHMALPMVRTIVAKTIWKFELG